MASVLSELDHSPSCFLWPRGTAATPQLWPAGVGLAGLTHSVISGTLSGPQALPCPFPVMGLMQPAGCGFRQVPSGPRSFLEDPALLTSIRFRLGT